MSRSSRRRKRLKARKADTAKVIVHGIVWGNRWMSYDGEGHYTEITDPVRVAELDAGRYRPLANDDSDDDWGDHEPPPRLRHLLPVVMLAIAGWALVFWAYWALI